MKEAFLRELLLLAEPVGVVWFALIILTMLLWWKRHRRFALTTGTLAIFITIIGSTPLPSWLADSLERPYAGVRLDELPTADAIVMLGGATQPAEYEAAGFRFTRAGDRVLMALELARRGKASVLVLGGAGGKAGGKFRMESETVRSWMEEWKLTSIPIIAMGLCYNTRDEAVLTERLAREHGWRRILLVTSASHMRRASAVFETVGLEVIPAPCNFLTSIGVDKADFRLHVPSAGGFSLVSVWLHEQAGWQMYRRRGWVKGK